ncbi:hypothetical protein SLEP1_g36158 [Rubroshorea leprosula]|uniref:Uncharacterized protein n=1 Tax=Rubroshorea leprosula TaxID=152421 RepID=A0AAV5KQL0_9ROSI|nr:hypothetical protein SLEP1_g36158 [Rubroshorea leprosula]
MNESTDWYLISANSHLNFVLTHLYSLVSYINIKLSSIFYCGLKLT